MEKNKKKVASSISLTIDVPFPMISEIEASFLSFVGYVEHPTKQNEVWFLVFLLNNYLCSWDNMH
jgi:hypothetical protein